MEIVDDGRAQGRHEEEEGMKVERGLRWLLRNSALITLCSAIPLHLLTYNPSIIKLTQRRMSSGGINPLDIRKPEINTTLGRGCPPGSCKKGLELESFSTSQKPNT